MVAAGKAALRSPSLRATLILPWWPTDLALTIGARQVAELERPGTTALAVAAGLASDSWSVGYTARGRDLATPMADHIALLARMARSKKPVQLILGERVDGLWRFDSDPVVTPTSWNPAGDPTVADVTFSLKRASGATVNVGLVKPIRGRVKNAAKKIRR